MVIKDFPDFKHQLDKLIAQLGREIPDYMSGFGQMHKAATADGVLPKATKELMALAIGIAVHCDGCIAYHVHDALKAGATRAEVLETIGVAVMMGGGPAVIYGSEAMEALNQFAPEPVAAA